MANASAVREWDSNGTVFGYNGNIPVNISYIHNNNKGNMLIFIIIKGTHRWRIRTQRFLLCRYCRRPLKQKHQRRPRFESYGFTRWNQRKTLWSFLFENLQNRSRSTRSHRFHLRIRSLNGSHPRINRICHRYVLCPLHSLQSHQSRKIIKWQ